MIEGSKTEDFTSSPTETVRPTPKLKRKKTYKTGLVSSITGTVVHGDMTTEWTTLIIGTLIGGRYAHVIQSTSSIFYTQTKTDTPEEITTTKIPTPLPGLILPGDIQIEGLSDQPVTEPNIQPKTDPPAVTVPEPQPETNTPPVTEANIQPQTEPPPVTEETREESSENNQDSLDVYSITSNFAIPLINQSRVIEESYETALSGQDQPSVVALSDGLFLSTLVPTMQLSSTLPSSTQKVQLLTDGFILPGDNAADKYEPSSATSSSDGDGQRIITMGFILPGADPVKQFEDDLISSDDVKVLTDGFLLPGHDVLPSSEPLESKSTLQGRIAESATLPLEEITTSETGSTTETTSETSKMTAASPSPTTSPSTPKFTTQSPKALKTRSTPSLPTFLRTAALGAPLIVIRNRRDAQEEELEADEAKDIEIYATPVTYYTTYTYFTTYLKPDGNTAVSSSIHVVSSILHPDQRVRPTRTIYHDEIHGTEPRPIYPTRHDQEPYHTGYTTYTYYTTRYLSGRPVVNTRYETITNVATVTITENATPEFGHQIQPTPTTYYTTYTYFTTILEAGRPVVQTRYETYTDIVSGLVLPTRAVVAPLQPKEDFRHDQVQLTQDTEQVQLPVLQNVSPARRRRRSQEGSGLKESDVISGGRKLNEEAKVMPRSQVSRVQRGLSRDVDVAQARPGRKMLSHGKRSSDLVLARWIRLTSSNIRVPCTTIKCLRELSLEWVRMPYRPTNPNPSPADKTKEYPTGLIQSVEARAIRNGATTVYATEVYGTFINGAYAQVVSTAVRVFSDSPNGLGQSAKSSTKDDILTKSVTPTSASQLSHATGLLSSFSNTVIHDRTTTAYTTNIYGTYIRGMYAHSSTHQTTTAPAVAANSETHISSEINTEIRNGATTLHTTNVYGTYINGFYAHVARSTSRDEDGDDYGGNEFLDEEDEDYNEYDEKSVQPEEPKPRPTKRHRPTRAGYTRGPRQPQTTHQIKHQGEDDELDIYHEDDYEQGSRAKSQASRADDARPHSAAAGINIRPFRRDRGAFGVPSRTASKPSFTLQLRRPQKPKKRFTVLQRRHSCTWDAEEALRDHFLEKWVEGQRHLQERDLRTIKPMEFLRTEQRQKMNTLIMMKRRKITRRSACTLEEGRLNIKPTARLPSNGRTRGLGGRQPTRVGPTHQEDNDSNEETHSNGRLRGRLNPLAKNRRNRNRGRAPNLKSSFNAVGKDVEESPNLPFARLRGNRRRSVILPTAYSTVVDDDGNTKTFLSSKTDSNGLFRTVTEVLIITTDLQQFRILPIKVGFSTRTDTITETTVLTQLTTVFSTITPDVIPTTPATAPPAYPVPFYPQIPNQDFSLLTSSYVTTETIVTSTVLPIVLRGRTLLSTIKTTKFSESTITKTASVPVPQVPTAAPYIPQPYFAVPQITTLLTLYVTGDQGDVIPVVTTVTVPFYQQPFFHTKVARSVPDRASQFATLASTAFLGFPIDGSRLDALGRDERPDEVRLFSSGVESSVENSSPNSESTSTLDNAVSKAASEADAVTTISMGPLTEVYEQPATEVPVIRKHPKGISKKWKKNHKAPSSVEVGTDNKYGIGARFVSRKLQQFPEERDEEVRPVRDFTRLRGRVRATPVEALALPTPEALVDNSGSSSPDFEFSDGGHHNDALDGARHGVRRGRILRRPVQRNRAIIDGSSPSFNGFRGPHGGFIRRRPPHVVPDHVDLNPPQEHNGGLHLGEEPQAFSPGNLHETSVAYLSSYNLDPSPSVSLDNLISSSFVGDGHSLSSVPVGETSLSEPVTTELTHQISADAVTLSGLETSKLPKGKVRRIKVLRPAPHGEGFLGDGSKKVRRVTVTRTFSLTGEPTRYEDYRPQAESPFGQDYGSYNQFVPHQNVVPVVQQPQQEILRVPQQEDPVTIPPEETTHDYDIDTTEGLTSPSPIVDVTEEEHLLSSVFEAPTTPEDEEHHKGRKRLKVTLRRPTPGDKLARTNSVNTRFVRPSRFEITTKPRFYVVTRTNAAGVARPTKNPFTVKVSKRVKSTDLIRATPSVSIIYETFTTTTSVPVIFGLQTSYREVVITASTPLTVTITPTFGGRSPDLIEPSETVMLTYFTTTTYTVPYTLGDQTLFTTVRETNSRIVTETHQSSLELFASHYQHRPGLSTRISDGVTLIVASGGDFVASTQLFSHQATPYTLQPTLLLDAVLMKEHFDGQNVSPQPYSVSYSTKTLFTTYTYFTTFFTDDSSSISSSEQVISNTVTIPVTQNIQPTATPHPPELKQAQTYLETSERVVTSTSYNTFTFYATLFNGSSSVVTPFEEVQSQVFTITESFTITRTIMPSSVATSFKDSDNYFDQYILIEHSAYNYTIIVTTRIGSKPSTTSTRAKVTPTVLTHFTTYTYFTTLVKESETIVSSSEEVITQLVSTTITPSSTTSFVPEVNIVTSSLHKPLKKETAVKVTSKVQPSSSKKPERLCDTIWVDRTKELLLYSHCVFKTLVFDTKLYNLTFWVHRRGKYETAFGNGILTRLTEATFTSRTSDVSPSKAAAPVSADIIPTEIPTVQQAPLPTLGDGGAGGGLGIGFPSKPIKPGSIIDLADVLGEAIETVEGRMTTPLPTEATTTVTTTTLIFNSITTTVVRTLVIPTERPEPTRSSSFDYPATTQGKDTRICRQQGPNASTSASATDDPKASASDPWKATRDSVQSTFKNA
ncbi:hypothetical protein HPB47_003730 [Ixodes persulcatus]|uniref:Uncharacterized protein n=1 Tax=Ixodes persulcatus TaxID=34615 RepID=A0AC60PIP7_IXOPE|nr:hypothetical protein HPB47_003730 [Ixodes persulcatus]